MANLTKLVSKLTPRLKSSLESAVGIAVKHKMKTVDVAAWVHCIIEDRDADLHTFLASQGVDIEYALQEIDENLRRSGGQIGTQPTISGDLVELIKKAWLTASVEMGAAELTPEMILLAHLQPNSMGLKTLASKSLEDISTDSLNDFANKRAPRIQGGSVSSSDGSSMTPGGPVADGALAKFTINLTEQARQGKLDPVLGRIEEIRQSIDILCRKRQNNPMLLGLPGVGKTAVVEGLAQQIVAGVVPDAIKNVEIHALDLGLLQAGASVKGEFEERLKNVIREVKNSDTPIIVFIDEAHTLIGAGGAEGQNDAANLLKPALARGEFRTVAATTLAEYKKYFEKDPALSRRFQSVMVEEPDEEVAVHILRNVAEGLSSHHGVFIKQEAVEAAVKLSVRYLPTHRLPDKAISILDTACPRVALSQDARPKEIDVLEEKVRFAAGALSKKELEAEVFVQEEDTTREAREAADNLNQEYETLVSEWSEQKARMAPGIEKAKEIIARAIDEGGSSQVIEERVDLPEDGFITPWVSTDIVSEVVADWTGVPVSNVSTDEAAQLLNLESVLKKRVVGQDAGLEAIAKSLRISRAGLTDTRKPIGVFLMCGPSGTGKTETALAIADMVFGGEDAVITINMTEFKELHKTSMLLGAAAGYVGYGQGGVLTEAVKRRPYSVVLLDEMEKAHPEVQDIFYQIFDKGFISDSEGTKVDFRNTIIIMTSNAAENEIRQIVAAAEDDEEVTMPSAEAIEAQIKPVLLQHFKPAFLGRAKVIPYMPLDHEASALISRIHLNRIGKRLKAQYGAEFDYTEGFIDHVVTSNNDPLSGGRAIERIINGDLLPRLASICIEQFVGGYDIDRVKVDAMDNKVTIELE